MRGGGLLPCGRPPEPWALPEAVPAAGDERHPEQEALAGLERQEVRRAIDRLLEAQRIAILLFYYEGMSLQGERASLQLAGVDCDPSRSAESTSIWTSPVFIPMNAGRERKRRVGIRMGLLAVSERDGPAAEADLLLAGQAGDLAALERLLALHIRPLLALCHGILAHAEDAEDATQETFLRALRALPRFTLGQATFRTWLFRIAVNVCLNWKRDHRPTEPWDEERLGASLPSASPEAIALRRLQVMEALRVLPPRHRAIFLLKVQEGWSVAEIGAAMGWSRIRVKNELSKARRTLADWQARGAERGAEP